MNFCFSYRLDSAEPVGDISDDDQGVVLSSVEVFAGDLDEIASTQGAYAGSYGVGSDDEVEVIVCSILGGLAVAPFLSLYEQVVGS